MMEVINARLNTLLKTRTIQFNVSIADRNQMINDTAKYVSTWDGGRNWVKWTDWKQCHVKGVRVWWNRIKAWKMGEFIFAPLIFQHLYQVRSLHSCVLIDIAINTTYKQIIDLTVYTTPRWYRRA